MNIVIIGGHLTPALAVIDYLQKKYPHDSVSFIGRVHSQESSNQLSHEAEECASRNIPFYPVRAIRGGNLLQGILAIPKLGQSVVAAISHLRKIHPDVVLSFGGYLAVPVCLAAWILGVPVVTHEQTRTAGSANQFIAKLARKVAVSFPETTALFPKGKTIVTGNPIRQQILSKTIQPPNWIPQPLPNKPLLVITGGNQGSQTINIVTSKIASQLLKDWWVIHQCGNPTKTHNYRQILDSITGNLTPRQQRNYCVREWLSTEEWSWALQHAGLVVGRSGANTTQELAVLGIPAVLIPLPFSKFQEQQLNAEWFKKQGGGVVLPQSKLTPTQLLKSITDCKLQLLAYKSNLKAVSLMLDGDKNLVELIHSMAT